MAGQNPFSDAYVGLALGTAVALGAAAAAHLAGRTAAEKSTAAAMGGLLVASLAATVVSVSAVARPAEDGSSERGGFSPPTQNLMAASALFGVAGAAVGSQVSQRAVGSGAPLGAAVGAVTASVLATAIALRMASPTSELQS